VRRAFVLSCALASGCAPRCGSGSTDTSDGGAVVVGVPGDARADERDVVGDRPSRELASDDDGTFVWDVALRDHSEAILQIGSGKPPRVAYRGPALADITSWIRRSDGSFTVLLASAGSGKVVTVSATGDVLGERADRKASSIAPRGDVIASADDGTLYSLESRKTVLTLGRASDEYEFRWSPSGRHVFAFWVKPHQMSMAWSDRAYASIADVEHGALLWTGETSTERGAVLPTASCSAGDGCAWNASETTFVWATDGPALGVWRSASRSVERLACPAASVGVAAAPDGRFAVAYRPGGLALLEGDATAVASRVFPSPPNPTTLAWSSDGGALVIGSEGGELAVLDRDGTPLQHRGPMGGALRAARFILGHRFVAALTREEVVIARVADGALLRLVPTVAGGELRVRAVFEPGALAGAASIGAAGAAAEQVLQAFLDDASTPAPPNPRP
jgi:hypothetical protein